MFSYDSEESKHRQAVRLCETSARMDDSIGRACLARLYQPGIGVEVNQAKAASYREKAIRDLDPEYIAGLMEMERNTRSAAVEARSIDNFNRKLPPYPAGYQKYRWGDLHRFDHLRSYANRGG